MSKDTFEAILSLKSWGVFVDEEVKELRESQANSSNNYFII
jgi:hypothetical protein